LFCHGLRRDRSSNKLIFADEIHLLLTRCFHDFLDVQLEANQQACSA
jgi:hypothetical protein